MGGLAPDIFFKLDSLQPSGSFKDRGIGHLINQKHLQSPIQQLICSSGGNAGHAVATAGARLGIDVSVFVPETTKPMMVQKLTNRGATVTVQGKNWNAADALAREALAAAQQEGKNPIYVP